MSGNTEYHNSLRDLLVLILASHVRERKLGKIISEQEFDFDGNAHGPDVSLIGPGNMSRIERQRRVQLFVPDLAIEIVSSNDTFTKLMEKAVRYRKCGTKEVWVLSPDTRQAFVQGEDRQAILGEADMFESKLLPGFSIRLGDLFDQAEAKPSSRAAPTTPTPAIRSARFPGARAGIRDAPAVDGGRSACGSAGPSPPGTTGTAKRSKPATRAPANRPALAGIRKSATAPAVRRRRRRARSPAVIARIEAVQKEMRHDQIVAAALERQACGRLPEGAGRESPCGAAPAPASARWPPPSRCSRRGLPGLKRTRNRPSPSPRTKTRRAFAISVQPSSSAAAPTRVQSPGTRTIDSRARSNRNSSCGASAASDRTAGRNRIGLARAASASTRRASGENRPRSGRAPPGPRRWPFPRLLNGAMFPQAGPRLARSPPRPAPAPARRTAGSPNPQCCAVDPA